MFKHLLKKRWAWLKLTSFFLLLILLTGILITRDQWLPFAPSYPYSELLAETNFPSWLHRLAGFDGVHYYLIVHFRGYLALGGSQAFFPLYPLLIYLGQTFFALPPLVVGLTISWLCLFAWAYLSQRLWRGEGSAFAHWWLAFALFFPTGFFYASFYTESLFLLLLILTYLAYRKRRFALVALFGAGLTATRVNGIIVIIALALDYLFQARRQKCLRSGATYKNLALIIAGASGLLTFMLYLGYHFADPLYFFTIQSQFWERQTTGLVSLPQVFYYYAKAFYLGLPLSLKTLAYAQEVLAAGVALLILAWETYRSFKKRRFRLPKVVIFWNWCFYLLPTLTGTFQSLPRYLLPLWVIPYFAARIAKRQSAIGYLLLALSCGTMLLNLILFLQGYWVA